MNRIISILVLISFFTACKEQPFVAIHLAPTSGAYSEAEYQQAVEAVKSRLYTQDIDFESVRFLAAAEEIEILMPSDAATPEQIERLTEHVAIGFWPVSVLSTTERLALQQTFSAEELETGPLSSINFISDGSQGRNDVLALSRDATALDTVARMIDSKLPEGLSCKWTAEASPYYVGPEPYFQLFVVEGGSSIAPVNQTHIEAAEMYIDDQVAEVLLEIAFDEEGTQLWEKMTEKAAYSSNNTIAITVGNRVLSAPRVREPIKGGRSVISGAFGAREADRMAQILNSGSLPMALTVIRIEQRKE